MQSEDFWFSAPKKGIMVFALPGEPGLTELAGDFKIQFHDRQGDFYWYANLSPKYFRRCLFDYIINVLLLLNLQLVKHNHDREQKNSEHW